MWGCFFGGPNLCKGGISKSQLRSWEYLGIGSSPPGQPPPPLVKVNGHCKTWRTDKKNIHYVEVTFTMSCVMFFSGEISTMHSSCRLVHRFGLRGLIHVIVLHVCCMDDGVLNFVATPARVWHKYASMWRQKINNSRLSGRVGWVSHVYWCFLVCRTSPVSSDHRGNVIHTRTLWRGSDIKHSQTTPPEVYC